MDPIVNSMTNYNLVRRIRTTLYALKRAFGTDVVLSKFTSSTVNYATLTKTTSVTSYSIHKCIVLPTRVRREVINTVSQLTESKTWINGGSYDSSLRIFVIDARDLPQGLIIDRDDYFMYDNRKYNIEEIQELEYHTGWSLIVKQLLNTTITAVNTNDTANLTDEVNND